VSDPLARNRWFLLIHQLPKEPAYLRVKVSRRLAGVGAIALKNSVYVLPKSESASEDFQWVRREIVAGGGEATVVEAELVEGLSDDEIEGKFREAKASDYAELIREARAIQAASSGRRKRPLSADERARVLVEVARLERRLEERSETDFFGASGRDLCSSVLRELRTQADPPQTSPEPEPSRLPVRARTWVTRTGIHVDRIASAWLIKRFIDPEASFKFVPVKGYVPLPGELRFDMFEAEFSHAGENCTFETLATHFGVAHAGVRALADIVHDIDLKESKFARPEAAGIAACITGLCRTSQDDDERLAQGSRLFEGLFAYFSAKKPANELARGSDAAERPELARRGTRK
jgi:hypothetical protein